MNEISKSDLLTPEERLDVYHQILLGRTIRKIELSRDSDGKLTGFLNIWFNDGGMMKLEDRDDTVLLDPAVDPEKLLEGRHWRQAMPDLSYRLLEDAKKALEVVPSG